jgi:phospholipid/cholesterol/gamma-HCH transport system permease protein
MIIQCIDALGSYALRGCTILGRVILFFLDTGKALVSTKLKIKKVILQMEQIGVNSILIVMLTGAFTGAVIAFQSWIGLRRYGTVDLIGPLVAMSMVRELGPVLTGLMVAGRAGSSIAAEIATMRITEQIDALETLSINVLQYLVVPRVIAGTIILPFLSLFTSLCGVLGGYMVVVHILHLNGEDYVLGIRKYVELYDITNGLIKSAFFGLILTWIGSYKGYYAVGGARGVGIATTKSVVIGSILILIANYFLTTLLF